MGKHFRMAGMFWLVLVGLVFALPAFAEPSNCKVQKRRIDSVLSESYGCKADKDCSVVSLPCDYGCYVALNGKQREIDGLLNNFVRNCTQSCVKQECPLMTSRTEGRCIAGRCEIHIFRKELPKLAPKVPSNSPAAAVEEDQIMGEIFIDMEGESAKKPAKPAAPSVIR